MKTALLSIIACIGMSDKESLLTKDSYFSFELAPIITTSTNNKHAYHGKKITFEEWCTKIQKRKYKLRKQLETGTWKNTPPKKAKTPPNDFMYALPDSTQNTATPDARWKGTYGKRNPATGKYLTYSALF